jgi:hypothetical protein
MWWSGASTVVWAAFGLLDYVALDRSNSRVGNALLRVLSDRVKRPDDCRQTAVGLGSYHGHTF